MVWRLEHSGTLEMDMCVLLSHVAAGPEGHWPMQFHPGLDMATVQSWCSGFYPPCCFASPGVSPLEHVGAVLVSSRPSNTSGQSLSSYLESPERSVKGRSRRGSGGKGEGEREEGRDPQRSMKVIRA